MKYVIAVIQPDKLEDVLEQLEVEDVHLVTASDVMGRGRQKGMAEIYRSHKEPGNLLRKVKIEIAVNDDFVERTVAAILKGARSGRIGDGKIFVLDLDECMRIRTGEHGDVAIG
jgi:nitrogen regulatory protein P-II 1